MKIQAVDGGFLFEDVKKLIASVSNDHNWQLQVFKDGSAWLSPSFAPRTHSPNVQFYLETFIAGNKYVGPDAAAKAEWVEIVTKALNQNWEEGYIGLDDTYRLRPL